MKGYDFGRQLKEGETAEQFLDSMFADRFAIRGVSRAAQRRGIDRIFTRRSDGKRLTIEYKADKTAASSGNAFVETISVDTFRKPGWAVYCQADYIFYYVVGLGPIYVLRPGDVRRRLKQWEAQCPQRSIPNGDYNTIGLLVPLHEFETLAVQVIPT